MTTLVHAVLRPCWLALRAFLELFVPRERLDAALQKAGFFAWKDRAFAFERVAPDGTVLLIHAEDEKIIREVHVDGCYAKPVVADGDLVVDVGGHVGVFTCYAARKTPRGRVLAFEPAPSNRELLLKNLARNGLDRVKVFDCALSDAPGTAELFFPGDHALYTLKPAGALGVSHTVKVRTLDEVFETERIDDCALLKIDAERSELAILRGATKALPRVRQLLVEAEKADGADRKVAELLTDAGFACEVVVDTPGGVVVYARRLSRT